MIAGLTLEQRTFWTENGYLVLPGHYSAEQVDQLEAVTDWVWRERPRALIVDETQGAGRRRMSAFAGARAGNRLKLNDLYLLSQTVRTVALEERLVAILVELLGDDPVLVNTLSIDVGTDQPMHADNLFMTPYTDDALVATWVALEDVGADQGPLFYYPGSHHIPAYRFSSGLQSLIKEEAADWSAFMAHELHARALSQDTFLARRGDVFIWHARLLHGGSPILNVETTRKSLVSHFFAKRDCVYYNDPIVRNGRRGFWLNRSEQAAPAETDRVAPPELERLELPAARATGCGTATIDTISDLDDDRVLAPGAAIERGHGFALRGWAVDQPGRRPLHALGVRLADGSTLRAAYGMGRHDVVAAYHEPAFNDCGFLAYLPAGILPPGEHVLTIVGVSADGATTYDDMATIAVTIGA